MAETTFPETATMYKAFVTRDTRFDGIFCTGVKSTGIFCRPACTARKPRPENVVHFASTKEALARGYRACMRCRPMELSGEMPPSVRQLLNDLQEEVGKRWLCDRDLRQRGLAPVALRRRFKKHHGMTFQP